MVRDGHRERNRTRLIKTDILGFPTAKLENSENTKSYKFRGFSHVQAGNTYIFPSIQPTLGNCILTRYCCVLAAITACGRIRQ